MPLWIHEIIHLTLSFVAGTIAWNYYDTHTRARKKKASPAIFYILAVGFGFFVDLDHLVDYMLAYGLQFDLSLFLSGTQFLVHNKNYVPLHGFEVIAILGALYFIAKQVRSRAIILAIALGLFGHLCFDIYVNEMKPQAYSIIFRAVNRFDIEPDLTPNHLVRHRLERERYLRTNELPIPR